eukprot:2006776-Rhodomonas_salina.1
MTSSGAFHERRGVITWTGRPRSGGSRTGGSEASSPRAARAETALAGTMPNPRFRCAKPPFQVHQTPVSGPPNPVSDVLNPRFRCPKPTFQVLQTPLSALCPPLQYCHSHRYTLTWS